MEGPASPLVSGRLFEFGLARSLKTLKRAKKHENSLNTDDNLLRYYRRS